MASNAIETQGTKFRIESATPGTFVLVGEVTDFSGFDGSGAVIDATSLDSTAAEKLMGVQDWGQVNISYHYVGSDAGQKRIEAVKASRTKTKFEMELVNGDVVKWEGYALSKGINGSINSLVGSSTTIEITGDVEFDRS